MYLYLLEFTYTVQDRGYIETWLSQADLGGVLISTEQYYDVILAVLASEQALVEAHKKLLQQPAITSCIEKRCATYCVTTTAAPELVIRSFPLGEDEDWYLGTDKTAYLCVQSHQLSDKQISWLNTNLQIVSWENRFDLNAIPMGC